MLSLKCNVNVCCYDKADRTVSELQVLRPVPAVGGRDVHVEQFDAERGLRVVLRRQHPTPVHAPGKGK